jgi:glucose-6-phosphate dehydrogenase assembly protein OpcA
MIKDLKNTSAGEISSTLMKARREAGSPIMGAVLTLVVATDEQDHYDAMDAAVEAAREHPARIVVVIRRPEKSKSQLNAQVRVGDNTGPGETIVLRLQGELADHADAVVLPLLLPDVPVVTWWPGLGPEAPSRHPLGVFAQRRVTDAASSKDAVARLAARAGEYRPGDTDLSWTRLTPWRSLLAAALDQHPTPVYGATVSSEEGNPSAELLALWLEDRLGVPVARKADKGPGITGVELLGDSGPVAIARPDGALAVLQVPGQPDRPVALRRRELPDLVAEELRRLDPDNVYASVLREVGRAPLAHAADASAPSSVSAPAASPDQVASPDQSDASQHSKTSGAARKADKPAKPAKSAKHTGEASS